MKCKSMNGEYVDFKEATLEVFQEVLNTSIKIHVANKTGNFCFQIRIPSMDMDGVKYDVMGFKLITSLYCDPVYELYVKSESDEFGKLVLSMDCSEAEFEETDEIKFNQYIG